MLSLFAGNSGIALDVAVKAGLVLLFGLGLLFLSNRRLAFLTIFFITPLFPDAGRALYPSLLAYYDLLLIALGIHVLCRRGQQYRPEFLDYLVIAYVLVGAVALYRSVAVFSVPFRPAFFDFFQRVAHAAVFFLIARGMEKRWVQGALTALVGGSCLAVAYGALQVVFGMSATAPVLNALGSLGHPVVSEETIMREIWLDPTSLRKAFALYPGPNALGGLIALVFPLALGRVYFAAPHARKARLLLAPALLLICAELTFSRATLVAIMIVLLVYLVHAVRTSQRKRSLALLTVLVCVPLLYQGLLKIGGSIEQQKTTTLEMKSHELHNAWQAVRQHPLGIGFGVAVKDGSFVFEKHSNTVSNLYLQTLVQLGFTGIAIFLLVIGTLAVRVKKCVESAGLGQRAPIFILSSAALGALANGLFDHTFLTVPALNMLLWAILGMLQVTIAACFETNRTRRGSDLLVAANSKPTSG